MERFVQTFGAQPDPYADDTLLCGWLDHNLGADRHEAARPALEALAADVAGPLRAAHADAEAHPPTLVRYDAWGARVDRIDVSAGWTRLGLAAAEHQVVGYPYLHPGPEARVIQHALLHLYGAESATFSCPVAMADGAAALLSRPDVATEVRDQWLPRLTAGEVTSGQWMTEAQGGSDVADTSTTAVKDGRRWRLTGEKWFCSAADSAIAVVLARPEGGAAGSRALAPFLVETAAPGVHLRRLKDKLGTRALPTAEIGLSDVEATPLGDPGAGGLARMMTLVTVTRLHNAAAAASGMRRGLDRALTHAAARRVGGRPLDTQPLHRATLGALKIDTAGAFVLAGHAFALLGAAEHGDRAAALELRVVAPLAKLFTARLAVAAASDYVECFGGAGYVEDTGIPRLLRDAQVLPIWEGTTNVLALDVQRALATDGVRDALFARMEAAGVQFARITPTEAGARAYALRLATALTAALLLEVAPGPTAELWIAARLGGADIAERCHRRYEEL